MAHRDGFPQSFGQRFSARSAWRGGAGTASHARRRPNTLGSRLRSRGRTGRGLPCVRREALPMTHIARGFPPARPLGRRIARATGTAVSQGFRAASPMARGAPHRHATRSWPKILGSRLYGSILRTFGISRPLALRPTRSFARFSLILLGLRTISRRAKHPVTAKLIGKQSISCPTTQNPGPIWPSPIKPGPIWPGPIWI